jgi:hypothetical protein
MGMAKLERRRDSDGRIRFSFRYIDVDGSRKRHTPDVETEHEALRIMAEVRARIARGIVGVPDVTANERQASTITLSAMLDRWLKEAHCTSKSPDRYRSRFASNVRRIIGVLGDGPIGTIRRGDVSRCLAIWEREGAVAATRNYWISTLSRLWVWGQDAGLIDEAEAHLHPRWQKTFLPSVQKIFPNLQLVVTTHSPFILASVRDAQVYVCRYDDARRVCAVSEETAAYQNKPVDEILMSPAFDETPPFGAEISKLLAARDRAIVRGDVTKRKETEAKLIRRNPTYFSYLRVDEELDKLAHLVHLTPGTAK